MYVRRTGALGERLRLVPAGEDARRRVGVGLGEAPAVAAVDEPGEPDVPGCGGDGLRRPPSLEVELEPAQPLERVRPPGAVVDRGAHRLAVLAVADHRDAGVELAPDDARHLLAEHLLEPLGSGALGPRRVGGDELGCARERPGVARLDAVGAAQHGVPSSWLWSGRWPLCHAGRRPLAGARPVRPPARPVRGRPSGAQGRRSSRNARPLTPGRRRSVSRPAWASDRSPLPGRATSRRATSRSPRSARRWRPAARAGRAPRNPWTTPVRPSRSAQAMASAAAGVRSSRKSVATTRTGAATSGSDQVRSVRPTTKDSTVARLRRAPRPTRGPPRPPDRRRGGPGGCAIGRHRCGPARSTSAMLRCGR